MNKERDFKFYCFVIYTGMFVALFVGWVLSKVII